jgi:hypothetical protein
MAALAGAQLVATVEVAPVALVERLAAAEYYQEL